MVAMPAMRREDYLVVLHRGNPIPFSPAPIRSKLKRSMSGPNCPRRFTIARLGFLNFPAYLKPFET
jgi:hypothetical protein